MSVELEDTLMRLELMASRNSGRDLPSFLSKEEARTIMDYIARLEELALVSGTMVFP